MNRKYPEKFAVSVSLSSLVSIKKGIFLKSKTLVRDFSLHEEDGAVE